MARLFCVQGEHQPGQQYKKLPFSRDYPGGCVEHPPRWDGTPMGLTIGYSGDWRAQDALLAGADAWFSVVAGLLPGAARQLVRVAASGKAERAARTDQAFEPLWTLFKEFGSFRVMYVLANLLDGDGIEPLRPLQPLAAHACQKVQAALGTLEENRAIMDK